MKPSDIYALTPIKTSTEYYDYIGALDAFYTVQGKKISIFEEIVNESGEYHEIFTQEARFEYRVYMNEGGDKYGGILAALYFNNKPLMIVKQSGRYYEDYDNYVTDEALFEEAVAYVQSKIKDKSKKPDIFSPDQDMEGLEQVAEYNLHDYYSTELTPKYQVDDIVWAWALENHLTYKFHDTYKGYVLTRVKIININQFNPTETYYGTQIDRTWGDNHTMVLKPDHGGIGTTFNDSFVVGKVSEINMPSEAINNLVDANGYLPDTYQHEIVE